MSAPDAVPAPVAPAEQPPLAFPAPVVRADDAPPAPRRVIAVASPSGGQGKTTVATNLAAGLSRIAPDAVVLVDADVHFGDVANALDLAPSRKLPDLVTGAASTEAVVLKTLLTVHPDGFFVVCGATSPVDGDRVTGEQVAQLVRRLSAIFPFVVVDTATGLGDHTLSVLDEATDVVAVTTLTVPALRALRGELAVLDAIGAGADRHLVLNVADERSGLRRQDAASIVGAAMDVVLPRSRAVSLAVNRGKPVIDDAPNDAASKALVSLLGRLTGVRDRKAYLQKRQKAVA